jgi:hypothetical protein
VIWISGVNSTIVDGQTWKLGKCKRDSGRSHQYVSNIYMGDRGLTLKLIYVLDQSSVKLRTFHPVLYHTNVVTILFRFHKQAMASPVKLLIISNASDSQGFQVISLSAPDANGNFGSTPLEFYEANLPPGISTGVVPSASWDSTNGDVLITFTNGNNGWIGLATLRPGRSIGELDWVGNGYKTNDPPSSLFYQNGPLIAYRLQNINPQSAVWRSPNWLADGSWTAQNLITGPAGRQVAASYAPALCQVGSDWIYSFYFGGNSPTNTPAAQSIYYNVIDPTGLSRGPVDSRAVYWNSYYTYTAI